MMVVTSFGARATSAFLRSRAPLSVMMSDK